MKKRYLVIMQDEWNNLYYMGEYKELKELNKRKMEASVKSHELGNELFENTIDTFNKTRNVQKAGIDKIPTFFVHRMS